MAVEPGGILPPALPESGIKENLVEDGPKQSLEIKTDIDQSAIPVNIDLPSINEELAKIFPESAHKFLQKKSMSKRGRKRKHPENPEKEKTKRGRGRPRKEVDSSQPSAKPGVSKKVGKVGRPRKRPEMSMDDLEKEMNMKESPAENRQKKPAIENNLKREQLRKKPRLSYVDTYVDDDDEEEDIESDDECEHKNEENGVVDQEGNIDGRRDYTSMRPKDNSKKKRGYTKPKERNKEQGDSMKHKKNNVEAVNTEANQEGEDVVKHEENNDEQEEKKEEEEDDDDDGGDDDVSEASLECDSYDESESGFESDNIAYSQGIKDKRRHKMDCLDEELPAYRIMKGTETNQAGLSRYQILKVRLLKFQATKGRGRPSNKLKISGSKRSRGRPKKNEIQTRILKVSLEYLPDLSIYSMPRRVEGHESEGQGQPGLLSQGKTVKRKPGRPPKVKLETQAFVTNGQSSSDETIGQDGSGETIGQDSNDQTIGQYDSSQTIGQDARGQTIGQDVSGQTIGQDASGQTIGQNDSGQTIGQDCYTLKQEQDQSCSSDMSVKYEDHSSSQNDSSCGQTCDERELKRKKKEKKKGRKRRDSLSKMTNVSVSIERLETVYDMKSLVEPNNIRLKQEETDVNEKNVTEEADDNTDIKPEVSDTVADKAEIELDCMKDEQDWEGGTVLTQNVEEQIINTSKITENKVADITQDGEDRITETEHNVVDKLIDTQNYYLNQELTQKKKRGRPPKSEHLKVPTKIQKPLDSHPTKKEDKPREDQKEPSQTCIQKVPTKIQKPLDSHPTKKEDKPREDQKEPSQTCIQTETLKTPPSGKARGRPKGRKNKQLEYELLIQDIVNKEEINNKNKQNENRETDFRDLNNAGTSKSDSKQSLFKLSKQCPSTKIKEQNSVKESSDRMDFISNFENESYTITPQDMFEFNDTGMDNTVKETKTNQSVSQLVETGSKNLIPDPLPVISDMKTNDSNPKPAGNYSKRKASGKPYSRSGSKKVKLGRPSSRTKSGAKSSSQSISDGISPQCCSVPESSTDHSHVQTSHSENSSNQTSLTHSPYKKKDPKVDDGFINKSSAVGSSTRLEASIDSDHHLYENRNESSMSQQNFSGGLLDFHASTDQDFLNDDYLLAF